MKKPREEEMKMTLSLLREYRKYLKLKVSYRRKKRILMTLKKLLVTLLKAKKPTLKG